MNKLIKFKLEGFDSIYILNGLVWAILFAACFTDTRELNLFSMVLGLTIFFMVSHYALKLVHWMWKHI